MGSSRLGGQLKDVDGGPPNGGNHPTSGRAGIIARRRDGAPRIQLGTGPGAIGPRLPLASATSPSGLRSKTEDRRRDPSRRLVQLSDRPGVPSRPRRPRRVGPLTDLDQVDHGRSSLPTNALAFGGAPPNVSRFCCVAPPLTSEAYLPENPRWTELIQRPSRSRRRRRPAFRTPPPRRT